MVMMPLPHPLRKLTEKKKKTEAKNKCLHKGRMKIQRGNPILCINSQRETVSKVLVLSLTGMKITQQIYPFC